MFNILRGIYSLLLTLLLPLVFFRLWLRGLKLPSYRLRWRERLGFLPFSKMQGTLWVHAVSVGEAIAAIPIIKRFLKENDMPVVITTTTPTGSERVKSTFKNEIEQKKVFHSFMPYDVPWALNKFLCHINPKMLLIMETELWPNMISICNKRNIPIILANARLSPNSIKQYKRFGSFFRVVVNKISKVCAQSEMDAQHYKTIGDQHNKIINIGNIKFDMEMPQDIKEKGVKFREDFNFAKRRVFIAASTHEGEEEQVLKAFANLKQKHKDLLLFLVPRHPDRFLEVENFIREKGFSFVKRSENQPIEAKTDIFLGNTMGEMLTFFAASDIAFVGGSLVPVGGHNLLEPAAFSLPVITGPNLFNFVYISEKMLESNACKLVQNSSELADMVDTLLLDNNLCKELGQKSYEVLQQNRGALDKLFKVIGQYI